MNLSFGDVGLISAEGFREMGSLGKRENLDYGIR